MRSSLLGLCGAVLLAACGSDGASNPPAGTKLDGGTGDAAPATTSDDGKETPDASPPASGAMVLDPSFGAGGKAVITLGAGGTPNPLGLVLQSTGGIVIGASPFDASGKSTASLFRLTSTGALDTTFQGGAAGASTDVIYGQLTGAPGGDLPHLFGSPLAAAGSPVLLRFLATGAPDPAFGTSGRSEKGSGGGIPVVLASGKVFIGLSGGANVSRLDSAGNLDPTWGASTGFLVGIASIEPIGHYEFRALGPLPDGRLLVGGSFGDATKTCGVIRLDTTGTLDKDFGEAHLAGDCSVVRAVFPHPDGSFIVQFARTDLALGLTRLTAAGAVDATYQNVTGVSDPFAPVLRRADDHLIAFAYRSELKTLTIVDVAPNGAVSSIRPLTEKWGQNEFIALQPDGKLIVMGVLGDALVVARYLP